MISLNQYTFYEHLNELKISIIKVLLFYIICCTACYYFKQDIYNILLYPLAKQNYEIDKIIYTGLAEAFFSYLKLAAFSGLLLTLPIINYQIYKFARPGLYDYERKVAGSALFLSPILFWLGVIFVIVIIMPRAWHFFLSFENKTTVIPIILEARISEYLNLVLQLILAFGIAFQLPIVIVILNLLNIINLDTLVKSRRMAILINFIIAGIITPPDIFSQFALALPMIFLYEISISLCKLIKK